MINLCIDVILPVYNGSATVRNTIMSVLNQKGNYVNKIIIIDDGSNDETSSIISSIKNSKIHYIRTSNNGVSSARNLGIEISKSEWLAFIDADDCWHPDKLFVQMLVAEKYQVQFICTSVNEKFNKKSGFISIYRLLLGNFIATSSVLVKKEILVNIMPVFSSQLIFGEDYLAWLKCITKCKGYFINNKLTGYSLSKFPRYSFFEIIFNLLLIMKHFNLFLSNIKISFSKILKFNIFYIFGFFIIMYSISVRFITSSRN